jgi:hypothetical protein
MALETTLAMTPSRVPPKAPVGLSEPTPGCDPTKLRVKWPHIERVARFSERYPLSAGGARAA